MKKLIIACCAVLAIGCGMMAGGWAAGGQLYGSYYDGELHPVSETVRDAVRVFDRLHFHTWWDGDGWIDDIVDDTLDDIDTAWVDSWLEQRQDAIDTPYMIPTVSVDQIGTLELTFRSGTNSNFSIKSGEDYGLEGDFFFVSSDVNERTWELEVAANGEEVVLTLPESQPSFDSITIESQLGACIDIDAELHASEIEISAENGTLDAEMLSAGSLDLSVSDGFLFAFIDHGAGEYHIDGKTNYGPFLLNDTELIGPGVRETRYDNRRDIQNPLYELDVKVAGNGRIGLSTLY